MGLALALLVAVLGVVVAVLARRIEREQTERSDRTVARAVVERVRIQFDGILASLRAGDVLLGEDGQVDVDRFAVFAAGLQGRPDVTAIVISTVVADDERDAWERSSGITITERRDGQFVPAPRRGEHVVVVAIAPDTAANRAVIGFDLRSESIRDRALDLAVATRTTTLTERLPLAIGDTGFIAFHPLFADDGARTATWFLSASLRTALVGAAIEGVVADKDVRVSIAGDEVVTMGSPGDDAVVERAAVGERELVIAVEGAAPSWATPIEIAAAGSVLALLIVAYVVRRVRWEREVLGVNEQLADASRTLEGQAARLRELNAAVGRFAAAATPDDVVRILAEVAVRISAADRAAVALLDGKDDQALIVRRVIGYPAGVGHDVRIDLGLASATADAFRSDAPVWVSDGEEHDRRYPGMAAEYRSLGLEAGAWLPLSGGARPSGVLVLNDTSPRRIDDDLRAALVTLARQGGLALRRATGFESEQRARRRAEVLERHASELASAATVEEIGTRTIVACRQLDGVVDAFVHLLHGEVAAGGEVWLVRTAGPAADARRYARSPLTMDSPVSRALASGAPQRVESGAEFDRHFPHLVSMRAELGYESVMTLPLLGLAARPVGTLSVTFDGALPPAEATQGLYDAIAQQCGVAMERALLQQLADLSARDAALLASLGDVVDRAIGVEERAQVLVDLLAAERAADVWVHLVGPVPHVASSGPGGADRAGGIDALATRCLDLGRQVSEIDQECALVATPLRARGRLLGTLTMSIDRDRRAELSDVFARRVATRAAVALDNALLYEREREVSHRLQSGLLGEVLAPSPEVAIAATYRPGTRGLEVGGDWYDSFEVDDRIAVVVGDVVGHGLEAAVATGQLRGAVRALAPGRSPSEVLAGLDRVVGHLPHASFTTLAYAVLDPSDGVLTFACAGHPPPLLVSGSDATYLWDGRSPPLGSAFVDERVEGRRRLGAGDTLVLYTDGLVERRRHSIDDGLARIAQAAAEVAAAPADDVLEQVVEAGLEGRSPSDDVCVVVVRVQQTAAEFRHVIAAAPDEVRRLRRAVASWAEGLALEGDPRHDLVLAVAEAAANAAEHGYGFDGHGPVEVHLRVEGRDVHVEVADRGTWREPAERTDRGRGLIIMRQVMRDVEVDRGPGGTTVRMRLSTGS